jgi:ribonuclease HI
MVKKFTNLNSGNSARFAEGNRHLPQVEMWTDGACVSLDTICPERNGCGGWAALLKTKTETSSVYGLSTETTSNRMELRAAIEGLRSITSSSLVHIYTDSAYVCNVVTKAKRWEALGFQREKGRELKNPEMIKEYLEIASHHTVIVHKVTSHADQTPLENEMVDTLAVAMRNLAASQKMFNMHAGVKIDTDHMEIKSS